MDIRLLDRNEYVIEIIECVKSKFRNLCIGHNSEKRGGEVKKAEENQNRGETILSVSGSHRGVHLVLVGERNRIRAILKVAVENSPALKEILEGLKDRETNGKG